MLKIAVGLIFGILIGMLIGRWIFKPSSVGILQVDRTNEFSTGPYLFLELNKEPKEFIYKKQATFDILLEDLAPRK